MPERFHQSNSFSNTSNERLFSLSVSVVALQLDLILFTAENRFSTEQLETGNVAAGLAAYHLAEKVLLFPLTAFMA